jgi:predicted ATPase
MREYVNKQMELGERGENLSAAAWRLAQQEETGADLLDWISELCGQEFRELGFVETSLGDVMMTVQEHDHTVTSARSLSDGTLRFLGQIVALLTAPEGSVLLFEEIENGLHPARVHLLVGLIDAVTKTRGIQVITTSHSGRLLDALPIVNALNDAVVFVRPPDQTTTVVRRFGDIDGFADAVERRGVEDLLATGWLERAVWMS